MRLVASGFCHTDHMVYEGAFKTKLPHTGSHEPTGTVAALGPEVSGEWKVGDRVGVYLFTNACGTCSGCKWYSSTHGGKLSARYCANQTMFGIVGADGGFAEYMLTSDDAIVKIPDEITFERKHVHEVLLLPLLNLSMELEGCQASFCSSFTFFIYGQTTPAYFPVSLELAFTNSTM